MYSVKQNAAFNKHLTSGESSNNSNGMWAFCTLQNYRYSLNFSRKVLLSKKSILLLAILLSATLTSGIPTHVEKLRYIRETGKEFPKCVDAVVPKGNCSEIRRKRDTMTLMEGQDNSLCPYRVCQNIIDTRTPKVIFEVTCILEGCTCNGSKTCTQLKQDVEFTWADGKKDSVNVNYGCVCAEKAGEEIQPHTPANGGDK